MKKTVVRAIARTAVSQLSRFPETQNRKIVAQNWDRSVFGKIPWGALWIEQTHFEAVGAFCFGQVFHDVVDKF